MDPKKPLTRKEFGKLIGLAMAAGLGAVFSGWLMSNFFSQLDLLFSQPSWGMLWSLAGGVLFFLFALAVFGILSVMEPGKRFVSVTAIALPLIIISISGFNIYSLIGAAISALGLFQYALKIREERRERLKASIEKFLRYGLGVAISAFLFLIGISFYGELLRNDSEPLRPEEAMGKVAASGVNQILALQLDGYDPEMTLDEFLLFVLLSQAEQALPAEAADDTANPFEEGALFGVDINEVMSSLDTVPSSELEELLYPGIVEEIKGNPERLSELTEEVRGTSIGDQIAKTREDLLSSFGIEGQGDETIGLMIEKIVTKQIEKFFQPFTFLLPPILALMVYFFLHVFIIAYLWVTNAFAWIIFHILKWSKFFVIREEERKAEIISLS
ncbi:MAG: hypothetical protein Q8Q20_02940 [bacterium]|nr:hypothetical protein [bacterium]